jgi:acyl-coenzyme A thioesterase PaaI-like protein
VSTSTQGGAAIHDAQRDDVPKNFAQAMAYAYEINEDNRTAQGEIRLTEQLAAPSGTRPRLSSLVTVIDSMVGITCCFNITPDVPVTVDCSLALYQAPTAATLLIETELVKLGRSITTAEFGLREARGGPLVGHGFMTFASTRNPDAWVPSLWRSTQVGGRMDSPFPDFVGLELLDDGSVEVALSPYLGNAVNGLQGGIVTLLAEVAAERLAQRDIVELDMRFLRSVGVGPGRASAVALSDDVFRAEVRDVGASNKLCAVMTARAAPRR